MRPYDRYWEAKKVTLIGAVINAFLGFIKLIGGFLYHSHALVADGVHSFSDLITDAMVLFASKFGSLDADASHPYGHQRIETAATLMLALLLILAGVGIAWDSLWELLYGTYEKPANFAFFIALLSIIINELLFYYTKYVGARIQSSLLIANAWHHRSDAASSLVVALGLLGSLFGFLYLDAVAAVIVGLMIIKMGLSYGWNSVKELVDTAVSPESLTQITHIIQSMPGVKKIHQLRSRFMGGDIYIDVHILVDPYISVSEGHYIAQHVHRALINKLPRVKDVVVHVDPEDDETSCPSVDLPSRAQLDNELFLNWKQDYPDLVSAILHYLNGEITLELIVNNRFTNWPSLRERIKTDLKKHPEIKQIRLLSQQETIN